MPSRADHLHRPSHRTGNTGDEAPAQTRISMFLACLILLSVGALAAVSLDLTRLLSAPSLEAATETVASLASGSVR